MRSAFLLIAALALAPSAAAVRAQPVTAATAPQRIAIPFNPPLDHALHYRATIGADGGRGATSYWTDYVLTFARRTDGIRLEVRMTDFGSSDIPADLLAGIRANMLAAFPPYVLLLDAQGRITGMEDEAGYWARMQPRIDEAMAAMSSGRRFDSFTLQSMNEAKHGGTAGLAESVSPIIGFAGTSYPLGQEVVSTTPVDDLMGLQVSERVGITAHRVADGRLFLTVSAVIPEAEIAAARCLLPSGPEAGSTPADNRLSATLRAARIARGDMQEIEIELGTGLVRRFRSIRRTEVEAGDARQRHVSTVLIEQRD